MIKPLLSLALSACLFPAAVNAAIINIEYTGYVSFTEGTALGYSIGDTVTGNLQIDLTKVPVADAPSDNYATYYAPANEHNVISGYHAGTVGNSADLVEVMDGGYQYNDAVEDFLRVSDADSEFILDEAFNFTSNFYAFYLEVLLPGVDWLAGNGLDHVNIYITDAALLANSHAQMFNVFAAGYTTTYSVQADVARITLDSLKITTAPQGNTIVSVPEGNTLMLFMLALAGLWVGRQHHGKRLV